PKPETRNPKPETRNPKPETRNLIEVPPTPPAASRHPPTPYTRNPTPETRNPKPEPLHHIKNAGYFDTSMLYNGEGGG
ncbi:hypothetical protein T484DRAFT_1636717, partial [Baffinella frigidus]